MEKPKRLLISLSGSYFNSVKEGVDSFANYNPFEVRDATFVMINFGFSKGYDLIFQSDNENIGSIAKYCDQLRTKFKDYDHSKKVDKIYLKPGNVEYTACVDDALDLGDFTAAFFLGSKMDSFLDTYEKIKDKYPSCPIIPIANSGVVSRKLNEIILNQYDLTDNIKQISMEGKSPFNIKFSDFIAEIENKNSNRSGATGYF